MWLIAHLFLLGAATVALMASGLRGAARLTRAPAARVLGGATLAVALAIAEALLLGLAGWGSNAYLLAGVALLTWLVFWRLVPSEPTRLRLQVLQMWRESGVKQQGAVGGFSLAIIAWTAYLLWHPAVGQDGLWYHLAEPAIWVSDGHPGSMHATLVAVPAEAYPRTMEVLFGWALSIGRTMVATVPLTVGCFGITILAIFAGLRRLGVSASWACTAAAAVVLTPVFFIQANGVYTDAPALAWLSCAAALLVVSWAEPQLTGLVLVAVGLAIGTKTTALPLSVVVLGVAFWRNRRWIRMHISGAVVAGVLATGTGPVWYLVNWARYGAPFFPFSSLPAGQPVPVLFRKFGPRFISHPLTDARAIGLHAFTSNLAGALILFAGTVLLVFLIWLSRDGGLRRKVLCGALVVFAAGLLWADSPFTGSIVNVGTVFAGFRYLLPVIAASAAVLGVATQDKGVAGVAARVLIVLSVAANVWELRHWSFPYRPAAALCLAVLVVGALLGCLLKFVPLAGSRLHPAILPVGVTLAMLLLAVPTHGFTRRHLSAARALQLTDVSVLSWLSNRPGWVHGSAPVMIGPEVLATLAGPELGHQISLVPDSEPCSLVRATAKRAWLVLVTGPPAFSNVNYRPPLCMTGIAPAVVLQRAIRIYAPDSLLGLPQSKG